jgi:hypothetical protein
MRKTFAAFQEMDICGGGGERARTALIGYFNDRIAPLLDQHHKPSVRRALFQAASEQTYLAGWMACGAASTDSPSATSSNHCDSPRNPATHCWARTSWQA